MKLLFAILVLVGSAFAQVPVLFWVDLPTGMCSGGEGNKGHWARATGKNFGASQDASHYVKIGSVTADSYKYWNYTDDEGNANVWFQLGTAGGCQADGDYNITVTTPSGTSNAIPLHIYSGGTIYFMDTANGDPSYNGLYPTHTTGLNGPFSTNIACRAAATAAPGNSCYMMPNSWDKTCCDGASYVYVVDVFGTSDKYMGILGYPYSSTSQMATIGCDDAAHGCTEGYAGLRLKRAAYFVLSGVKLTMAGFAYSPIEIGTQTDDAGTYGAPAQAHHLVTDNLDIFGPKMQFSLGYVAVATTFLQSYGNHFHDIASVLPYYSRSSGHYYMGDQDHDWDVGWNFLDDSCIYVWNCPTNKPFEVHSTGQAFNVLKVGPTIQSGSGSTAGDVRAVVDGSGTLAAGVYDVITTWRLKNWYGSNVSDFTSPAGVNGYDTESPISASTVSVTIGGSNNAIAIKAPTGWDYLHWEYDPREYPGVGNVCNPSLAYKVYVCKQGADCGSGPLYQGEATYTAPNGNPDSEVGTDYTLISYSNAGHPYITPEPTWGNPVSPGQSYRHVMSGCRQYNIAFHDSKITFAPGYPITWTQTNPSTGYVRIYNNEVSNAGNNWNWNYNDGIFASTLCLNFEEPGDDSHDHIRGGTIQIYNNTFYNCGRVVSSPQGVSGVLWTIWSNSFYGTPTRTFDFKNNILVQPESGQQWLSNYVPVTNLVISGSNNLCYGPVDCSTVPWNSGGNGIFRDPKFTANGTRTLGGDVPGVGVGGPIYEGEDLTPQVTSPVWGAGVATFVTRDINGLLRPNPPSIGPYELSGASTTPQSTIKGTAKMKGASKTKP